MPPIVLHESAVKPFCFYLDGNLRQGVSYHNRLYHLVETLSAGDIEGVRNRCLDLRRRKLSCIVTKSERYYRIWTDLRAMETTPEPPKPPLPPVSPKVRTSLTKLISNPVE